MLNASEHDMVSEVVYLLDRNEVKHHPWLCRYRRLRYFDISKPESWQGWITRFEGYCSIAGLRDAENVATKKLNTLLHLLGEKTFVTQPFSVAAKGGPTELQMELIYLQRNEFIKRKFQQNTAHWLLVQICALRNLLNLKKNAARLMSLLRGWKKKGLILQWLNLQTGVLRW